MEIQEICSKMEKNVPLHQFAHHNFVALEFAKILKRIVTTIALIRESAIIIRISMDSSCLAAHPAALLAMQNAIALLANMEMIVRCPIHLISRQDSCAMLYAVIYVMF